MSRWLQILEFPLLRKELTELAARPRTYFVRVFFALLAVLLCFSTFRTFFNRAAEDPVSVMGTAGPELFMLLFNTMLGMIFVFTPAVACGAITNEKEKNTIGLLFLSRLGPWAILLEKLLSRSVPVFSFLLISMPLFAIAFAFGGVDTRLLFSALAVMFLLACSLATISIMCSAFARTTSTAFMASYVIGMAVCLACGHFALRPLAARFWNLSTLDLAWILFEHGTAFTMLGRAEIAASFIPPFMLVPPVALLFARYFLVRRAFLQPRYLLLRFFKFLDETFFEANRKYTGGIVLIDDQVGLPDDEPIAWRETKKRSLGTIRYLFRIFLAIELPVLGCCLIGVAGSMTAGFNVLSIILMLTWSLVALLLAVQSSGLIASERSRETLAPLLTTMLSGEDIIRQKYAGVRRAILILRIPLLTVVGFQLILFAGYRFWSRGMGGFSGPLYLVASLLAIWIFPHLIGWLGFFVSLRIRSQTRAVLTTVSLIVAWCLVPYLIGLITGWGWIANFSPSRQIVLTESRYDQLLSEIYGDRWRSVSRNSEYALERAMYCWAFVAVSFAAYVVITMFLKHYCLRLISALGRGEQSPRQSDIHRDLRSNSNQQPDARLTLAEST